METVNTNPQPHRSHANNVWAGLIILAIGVIFLLDRLGFNMPVFLFSWPTLLIAIGIINGIKHNFKNPTWIILVIVGTMFLLDDMNVFWRFNLRHFIAPIAIIAVGLMIIFRSKKNNYRHYCEENITTDQDHIDSTTVFGGSKKTILSKNFKGGELTTIFGGNDINLSQADINGTVAIDMTTLFGGTKLIIPANWEIRSEMVTIFGGLDDKRPVQPKTEGTPKVLILTGTTIFGGIDIKSY